jgi:hypothetical protein
MADNLTVRGIPKIFRCSSERDHCSMLWIMCNKTPSEFQALAEGKMLWWQIDSHMSERPLDESIYPSLARPAQAWISLTA